MKRKSNFKPAWWLPGAHLQTIWATFARRDVDVDIQRERLELPDGDFLDLDWAGSGNGPIVLILHGLGGSISSPYAKGLLRRLTDCGWRAVFMHFRGCSDEPNRLPRSYHSGETADAKFVAAEIKRRAPNTPLAAVGFSLGGNVLLKWLGENPESNDLMAGIAISVPFELHKVANKMNSGCARLYQRWLLKQLKLLVKNKHEKIPMPLDLADLNALDTFWKFDEKVTAPLHGFTDAQDYYTKASSRAYLQHIRIPTLILHAIDDPFMTPDIIPELYELSQQVILEISDSGGHVGFITGNIPWQPIYWLENRIVEFLQNQFNVNPVSLV